MAKHHVYEVVRETKTKVLNIATSLILVGMTLGGALPAFLTQKAFADSVVTVCASGCTATTIQGGVDAAIANAESTVDVQAGTYNLTSTVNITQPLTIMSGSGAVITADNLPHALLITGAGTTVSGLTFSSSVKMTNTAFIGVQANDVTLTNNTFTADYVAGDGQVTRGVEVSPGVQNVGITHNNFNTIRQPAYINNGVTGTVSNNYAEGTKGWVVGSDSNVTFTDNTWGTSLVAGNGDLKNAVDIAIVNANSGAAGPDNYNAVALSQGNNGAAVDDQVVAAPTDQQTDVYVDSSAAVSGNGYWNTPFQTITAGLNAVIPGGTVHVAAGTYDAFSVTNKTGVTIEGAGVDSTTIAPSVLVNTGIAHKYTSDMKVSVLVNDSTDITIKDMTVTGNGSAPGFGGPDALVFWNASTGTIRDSAVTGDYTINGDQTGQGIAVDASGDQTANLAVTDTAISGFQKNAIEALDGNGSTSGNSDHITLTVTDGSITGAGATGTIAQNGILAWNYGGGTVDATVSGTTISSLHYTGNDQDVAVYAYGGASISSVSNVTFTDDDLYIYNGSGAAVDATSGNTFDGVSPASATAAQLGTIENKLYGSMEDSSSSPIYIVPNTWIATTSNRGVQAGVNESTSGDTVIVTPGTYNENVTVSRPITLEGAQAGVVAADTAGVPRSGSESTVSSFSVNASDVTIDGFSLNKAGIQMNIGSIAAIASGDVIENNIFSGYASVGMPTENTGNLKVQGNYFTAPAANSEPMQIKATLNGGCSGTEVSGNVFNFATNNGSADINFSCTGSNSTGITVSGNTDLGNTGGTSFVSLAGIAGDVTVSGNVVSDVSGSAIFFWGGVSGTVTIQSNAIMGDAGSVVSIQNMGSSYGANSGNFTISGNNLSGNAFGVKVASGALSGSGTVDASGNWWGNALGPDSSQYSSNVILANWCSDSNCSSTQTASSGTTSLPTGPIATPSTSGNTASVTIPGTNQVVATTITSTGTIQVTIPAGTVVTASSANWNGTITPPTVTTVSLGTSKDVSLAIEVGAGNTSLTFDNAARLLLPGQAGKSVGFVRNGVFTPITEVCSADSQAAGNSLPAGGDCYITVGSDLAVWTKHFTTFVAYSNATSPAGSSNTTTGNNGGTASPSGHVLGASTVTPSTGTTAPESSSSSSNTSVKGASTTNPKTQKSSTAKSGNFLGLGWWWLLVLAAVIVGAWYLVAARRADQD